MCWIRKFYTVVFKENLGDEKIEQELTLSVYTLAEFIRNKSRGYFIVNQQNESTCLSRINEESASNKNSHLPKMDFKKFNGDVKTWIGFWGQINKIHCDDGIVKEDGFF